MIDNGSVSIDFESVKQKPNRGQVWTTVMQGMHPYIYKRVMSLMRVLFTCSVILAKGIQIIPLKFSWKSNLTVILAMLRKSQVDTNNAIRALTDETKKIKDSHEKSEN